MFNLPSNVVTWRDSADMFASKLIDATSLLEVYPLATNAFFAAYIYDYLAANPTITSDTSILTSSLNNLIIPSSYATLNDYLNALYALYSIPLSIVTQSNATNDFIFNAIASTAFNQGQLALLTSNAGVPNFIPANASALTSCNGILGIAVDNILIGAAGNFLLFGKFITTGLVTGAEYFVNTFDGSFTNVKPNGSTQIVKSIGYALSETILFFNPSSTYIELV
ncbi:MAG: hypothetical protein CO025_11860 [Ignavibacteria bacterium CG_4_9_14_0_2_um_filter_37_13]|nr:MAG: hypothetical protein CO025_11860 [Ignavibacteria bacterium CG_4_9_14_0_2_um_filter_37_13]